MSEVRGYFKPDFQDESIHLKCENEDDENPHFFSFHDIYAGSIIVGIDLGNKPGAHVYKFYGLSSDPREAAESLRGQLVPQNVAERVKPFFRSDDFPARMDDGEPGVITVVHLPLVEITPVSVQI
jgi:hypothetical protein